MAAGTRGTPASSAIRAAPLRQRASCRLRSPFSRRVPSGNMTTMCPSRQSRWAGSHRLQVVLAATDPQGTTGRDERPEWKPEQLRFRHEAQVPPREQGHPERPRVEIRQMICCEDVAARCRKPFEALPALPKDEAQHGVAERADGKVGPAGARIFGHRPFQYPPFRTLAVSRSLAMVTRAPGRRPGGSCHPTRKGHCVAEHRLVIVESPAKAKTIAGYLGDG